MPDFGLFVCLLLLFVCLGPVLLLLSVVVVVVCCCCCCLLLLLLFYLFAWFVCVCVVVVVVVVVVLGWLSAQRLRLDFNDTCCRIVLHNCNSSTVRERRDDLR